MPHSPSMKRIADVMGISRATVSNALTGKGRVSKELAERIRATAAEMNYVPSRAARALRMGSSTLVGLVVPDFSMPLFAAFAQAFERAARDRNLALTITDGMSDPALQHDRIAECVERGVDGLIVIPMRGAELDSVTPVPLVIVDADSNPRNVASCDHREGGRLMAAHLADLGHRSVRIVTSSTPSHVSRTRLGGATTELEGRGVAFTIDTVVPSLDGATAYGRTWAGQETAILCIYDTLAVGIVSALVQRGISVPDNVSVVGFDDLVWGRILTPQITTVRQDLSATANHALDVVLGLAEGSRLAPVELLVRGSTAPPAPKGTP